MIVTAQQLIESPRTTPPHVVLLGAGASRAAFPNGDAAGRCVPLMDDLIDIIKLRPLLDQTGLETGQLSNFEIIYGQLASEPKYASAVKEIERRMCEYFSSLSLPNEATIYDQLLISLRSTDAVFTFNWDPFLFDAYQRNRCAVPLPKIFFLHGNVRIGACAEHDEWGARKGRCSVCGQDFSDAPLLYPIKKDYSKDPYIRRNWEAARTLFSEAFTITFFGYGAPASDADAVNLMKLAWFSQSKRTVEHLEIIDTAPQTDLHDRWSPFTPTLHYRVLAAFKQCRIALWPRRSCESLFYPMTQGLPCENFPLPSTKSLAELQRCGAEIARYEEAGNSTIESL